MNFIDEFSLGENPDVYCVPGVRKLIFTPFWGPRVPKEAPNIRIWRGLATCWRNYSGNRETLT